MLTAIRERTQGWIAYVVVGVIVIVMAAFGLHSYFSGPPSNEVAEVEGVPVTAQALDAAYRQQRQQLAQMFGGQLDPELFEEEALRRRALDQLINEMLLRQYIDAQEFRVSDAVLAEAIRSQEAFQQDGRFSPELYRTLLRANGLTPQAYEAQMRLSQALAQLQQGIVGSAFVTDWELERLLALQSQEREVSYLRVPVAAFEDEVELTQAQIEQYYQGNADQFRQPERVRLSYVALDPQRLAQQIEVSEEAIRERYDELRDTRYTEGGRRRLRHILIALPADADDEQIAEAQARLAQWREQIAAGEASFEELAREFSEDPGSAEQGGDLGFVDRGVMVEAFEEAGFALAEGEISEPVRTEFGLHLIQATEVEPARVQPLEAVRDELRRDLAAERADQELIDRANRLATLAYEEPETLEPAAEALGLEVQQTDWIPRDGAAEGLGAEPAVVEAAFSPELLDRGYNSELIELSGGRRVVIRVAEHQAPELKPLEQVADEVRERLVAERAAALARDRAEQLRAALAEGRPIEELAEGPVELRQPGYVSRRATDVPRPVLQRVFELRKPAEGEPSRDLVELPEGDVVVVQVSGVREGEGGEDQREQLASRLAQLEGSADLVNLLDALRARADVEIYENRL